MTIQSMPTKSAIVALHDAASSFSKRIFEFTTALGNLGISFNIGVIPFYRHKEDLPQFPEFVDKIKSLNNAEIVLHGLYHEMAYGMIFYISQKEPQKKKYVQPLRYFRRLG
jgi:predicted deacetylase